MSRDLAVDIPTSFLQIHNLLGLGVAFEPGSPHVFQGVADAEIVVLSDLDALDAARVRRVMRRVVDRFVLQLHRPATLSRAWWQVFAGVTAVGNFVLIVIATIAEQVTDHLFSAFPLDGQVLIDMPDGRRACSPKAGDRKFVKRLVGLQELMRTNQHPGW